MKTVDAIFMGRNTFETVLSSGHWYYGRTPLIVLSSRDILIPERRAATVEHWSGTPAEVVGRLEAHGARHLYVDGGKTIQSFLRDGLINRRTITRIPVLLGRGIPLFGETPRDVRMQHVATRSFANGLVQSEYDVVS